MYGVSSRSQGVPWLDRKHAGCQTAASSNLHQISEDPLSSGQRPDKIVERAQQLPAPVLVIFESFGNCRSFGSALPCGSKSATSRLRGNRMFSRLEIPTGGAKW